MITNRTFLLVISLNLVSFASIRANVELGADLGLAFQAKEKTTAINAIHTSQYLNIFFLNGVFMASSLDWYAGQTFRTHLMPKLGMGFQVSTGKSKIEIGFGFDFIYGAGLAGTVLFDAIIALSCINNSNCNQNAYASQLYLEKANFGFWHTSIAFKWRTRKHNYTLKFKYHRILPRNYYNDTNPILESVFTTSLGMAIEF